MSHEWKKKSFLSSSNSKYLNIHTSEKWAIIIHDIIVAKCFFSNYPKSHLCCVTPWQMDTTIFIAGVCVTLKRERVNTFIFLKAKIWSHSGLFHGQFCEASGYLFHVLSIPRLWLFLGIPKVWNHWNGIWRAKINWHKSSLSRVVLPCHFARAAVEVAMDSLIFDFLSSATLLLKLVC